MLRKVYRKIRQSVSKNRDMKKFRQDFEYFNSLDKEKRLSNKWKDIYPCLRDNTGTTPFDAHYVYHPAWAARILKKLNPSKHIDISSTIHFCTILSAFVPTEFYDYRPANLNLSNLISERADLTELFFKTGTVESISCMHTIEHVGLGRYGDKIDPNGDLKAIAELQRVVRKGGSLFLVTPVGKPRIQYNAHRIYSFELINDLFSEFTLQNFSLIDDSGNYLENAAPELVQSQAYGCGCFWYLKK